MKDGCKRNQEQEQEQERARDWMEDGLVDGERTRGENDEKEGVENCGGGRKERPHKRDKEKVQGGRACLRASSRPLRLPIGRGHRCAIPVSIARGKRVRQSRRS